MEKRLALLLFTITFLLGCAAGPPDSPAQVAALQVSQLPDAADDSFWNRAPVHTAPLILQDLVEPRLMQASTKEMRVQAAHDGSHLVVRLEWEDPSADDLPGVSRFPDACAIQLPAEAGPDVPAPQMGEEMKAVEIAYWSASWQATVNGRPDSIKELYPGATVDHYPFEAPALEPSSVDQAAMAERYSPARAVGNPVAGPREKAVQDLIAKGPGTLTPAPTTRSEGRGQRTPTGWVVVIKRPLPEWLRPGQQTQIALAVWQGAAQEAGARKMRSVWIPLSLESAGE